MSLRYYADHNIHGDITRQLLLRGIDCLTLQDDHYQEAPDDLVLERAVAIQRVVLTSDKDLLRITAQWIKAQRFFPGVIHVPQNGMSIGAILSDLETLATASLPGELDNILYHLPIQ